MFGGSIKGEKKRNRKVKTGSKSGRINEAGKDEDLESKSAGKYEDLGNRQLEIDDLDSCGDSISDFCYIDGSRPIDFYGRLHRVERVEGFIHHYKFALGEKFCIPSDRTPTRVVSDYCFDSTLVGVHGMQSICTVFRRDMDMTRLPSFYQEDSMKHHNMRMFAKAAISEVECLRHKDVDYYDDDFRRSCTVSFTKPFAVVSQGLGTLGKSGYKFLELSRRFPPETIDYLESVVFSDSLHTHYGVIRAAIKAYQMCFQKVLRADDIWVTILDVKSGWFDHLPLDIIEEQLNLVNGLSSEKDPQKPLFVSRGHLC